MTIRTKVVDYLILGEFYVFGYVCETGNIEHRNLYLN